jgi:transcriptional regulator with XRE-family HTH domain
MIITPTWGLCAALISDCPHPTPDTRAITERFHRPKVDKYTVVTCVFSIDSRARRSAQSSWMGVETSSATRPLETRLWALLVYVRGCREPHREVFTCAAVRVARYASVWGVCGSLCGVDSDVDDGAREDAPASGDDADPTLARLRDFVARRRAELGLSQRKLAELAGVSLGTATRLERGAGPPRVSTVPKLEDALQWPRGTFQAIRDGEDPPKVPPRPDTGLGRPAASGTRLSATTLRNANQYAQALSIASAVVAITAVCLEVLTSESREPAGRAQALSALDAHMREMESLIAASLPDAESFDDAMEVLREVHQSRESIQKAAESLS